MRHLYSLRRNDGKRNRKRRTSDCTDVQSDSCCQDGRKQQDCADNLDPVPAGRSTTSKEEQWKLRYHRTKVALESLATDIKEQTVFRV